MTPEWPQNSHWFHLNLLRPDQCITYVLMDEFSQSVSSVCQSFFRSVSPTFEIVYLAIVYASLSVRVCYRGEIRCYRLYPAEETRREFHCRQSQDQLQQSASPPP